MPHAETGAAIIPLMPDNPVSSGFPRSGQPRCFLFDFGNVIGLFDPRIAYREIISLSGATLELDQVHHAVHSNGNFQAFEKGAISADEFLGHIRDRLQIQVPLEDLARAWVEIMRPNDDVIAVLPVLKKASYRLVLGSNNNELHYRKVWVQFSEPLSLFDDHVFSHQVGAIKPDPAFFEACAEACGSNPADTVYVDDLEVNIEAGKKFGFQSVHYRPGIPLLEQFRKRGITP
jgi:glucose-1-phosphatase